MFFGYAPAACLIYNLSNMRPSRLSATQGGGSYLLSFVTWEALNLPAEVQLCRKKSPKKRCWSVLITFDLAFSITSNHDGLQ